MKPILSSKALGLSSLLLFISCLGCSAESAKVEQEKLGKQALPIPEFSPQLLGTAFLNLDDGPFWGAKFTGDVNELEVDEQIPFRDGELYVCNRSSSESPILYYRSSGGNLVWTVDLDPSVNPDFDFATLKRISGCRLSETSFGESLGFLAEWTFGIERGYSYFGPNGELGCFYLSW